MPWLLSEHPSPSRTRENQPVPPPTLPVLPAGLPPGSLNTTLNDVPATVRDRAKHLVLDGIACAIVGAQLPVSRIGVEGVTALDSAGDTPLIGWDGRETSATSAAMVNSSFIQGFELDDYHPLAPLHSNSIILPAMLAAAPRVAGLRRALPPRRHPRVRDRPPSRPSARRPGHALPRMAFGRGLRPHCRGRGRRDAVRAGRSRVSRTPSG